MVAEKTAKDARGLLYFAAPCRSVDGDGGRGDVICHVKGGNCPGQNCLGNTSRQKCLDPLQHRFMSQPLHIWMSVKKYSDFR